MEEERSSELFKSASNRKVLLISSTTVWHQQHHLFHCDENDVDVGPDRSEVLVQGLTAASACHRRPVGRGSRGVGRCAGNGRSVGCKCDIARRKATCRSTHRCSGSKTCGRKGSSIGL